MSKSPLEVRFYHLTTTPLEKALPKLLEKIISQGHRILILTDSEDQTESIAIQLWTYSPLSFLPHGTHKDGFEKDQPIFLTSLEENPNNADILIILNGKHPKFIETFTHCFYVFEDMENTKKLSAVEQWENYQKQPYLLSYWMQKKDGSWEKTKEKNE
ncbi:MAG: DNA polymerase III subunit chi [Proteobacteria bacterium]|nr:DNA polymerase III subunit chi [Pseudomonadota bacterium]